MKAIAEIDTDRIGRLAETFVNELGAELIEVKIGSTKKGQQIVIIVDAERGISIETCSRITKRLRNSLYDENYAGGNFKIEVSSPGVDRPLVTEDDFRRKTGRKIELWHDEASIASPVEGVIKSIERNLLLLEEKGITNEISLDKIDKGLLKIEIR
ncbi:MAG: hypothetical protein IIC40_07335 [Candidatus Marinimicrobia bacterium]|nr:hypothetical protein [Candidatus Neomarinimicrobiota bacterium]